MNWYKTADITQTWDKYLQQKVRQQIPNKEEQFYLNFRQGLINAEQLFDDERDANSFINTYLAKNVMSLADVDTGHIGDRIFSDIRGNYQATLPAEQRQEIKMNEVKQILFRELPGFNEGQINALAQDIVFNNKNVYEVIKKNKGDEVTDTKRLIDRQGIYNLYQITNWGTNGKLEKHLDTKLPEKVHKDLENTSVCVRFGNYFENYIQVSELFLIEKSGKPYILYTGDNEEIKYTENNEEIFDDTSEEDQPWRADKNLLYLLNKHINLLNVSIVNQDTMLFAELLSSGVKPSSATLNEALGMGNIKAAKMTVEMGVKADEETFDLAIWTEEIEAIKLVDGIGAKPDENSLHSAFRTKNAEIIQLVIDLGAKPDQNALGYAIGIQNAEIVKLVIQAGAKPDESSMDYAIGTKNAEIIQLVIQTGAELSSHALKRAIKTQNAEIVKLVIQAGAKPDIHKKRLGNIVNTLNEAVQTNNIEIVKLVIQAGAKPDGDTNYYAHHTENPEIIQLVKKSYELLHLEQNMNSNKNWYTKTKTSALTNIERSSLEAPGGKIEQEVNIGGYDLFISSLPFFGENMPRYQIGIKREDLDISTPEAQFEKREIKLPQEDYTLVVDKMQNQIRQWINQYGPLLAASMNADKNTKYNSILSSMGFSVNQVNMFGTTMNIVT
jgi:ankyrin repeat protein